MFQTSADKSLPPELQAVAEEIEERTPGLYVVAAKQYQYPLVQSAMDVWVSEPRRFNVLEEFVLRAALELDPPPAVPDLAEAFGLDQVFLDKTCRDLAGMGAVTIGEDKSILLTPDGRTFYQEGQVPQPPKHERVYFLHDSITKAVTARSSAAADVACDHPRISDLLDTPAAGDLTENSLEEKRAILSATLPGIHDPKQGRIATSIELAAPTAVIWQPVSLFLLHDDLEQRWVLQARKGRTRIPGADRPLEGVIEKGPEHFLQLFDVTLPGNAVDHDKEAAEVVADSEHERSSRLQALVWETLWRQRKAADSATVIPSSVPPEPQGGTVSILRNEKIRPEFISLLNSAKREVIVFSPWITEQVVDDDFLSMLRGLASRNVWVLIGYGIARSRDREERVLPPSLVEKIHAIRSPQGAAVIRVVWLGGSHAKEVVVDGEVFLHGSFNWLSYRGDRCVRGETISRITIPEHVAGARNEYCNLFLERAMRLWRHSCNDNVADGTLSALSIMGALGKELDALNMIASEGRLELLPEWTRIISNNLVHGDLELGALCLAEASELFGRIEPDVLAGSDFGQVWKETLRQVKAKNAALAQELIQHPSWEHYLRLGLAQPEATPEGYLAEASQTKLSFQYKKMKKKKK